VELVRELAQEMIADNRPEIEGRTLILPLTKSRHTANEIVKDAGLPKRF
jgi:hypothetical protein